LTSGTEKPKDKVKPKPQRKPLFGSGSPFSSTFKREQKEKEALAKEGRSIRVIAFIMTMIAMALALSLIPLFPQPLPIIIAILLAFAVYVRPPIGMAVGSMSIAIAILYQLSRNPNFEFIGGMESTMVRVLFICVLLFFFIGLTIRFRSYEDAVGINLGIIAAGMLFFDSTFFMAVPLLITVAIVFKKTQAGLAFVYYALISVPLMLLQYWQYIVTIKQVDFWNVPGSVPPIYTSLAPVLKTMQSGMTTVRLFDFQTSLGKITWNVVEPIPTWPVHSVGQALAQYRDSFSGMIIFIILVAGLVFAFSLIMGPLASRGSGRKQGEAFYPALAAAGLTAVFFVLLTALKTPLAFSTKITTTTMALGILSSLLFSVPAAILNFAPKKKAEAEKNSELIVVKAGNLLAKLKAFEPVLEMVKENVPVDVKGPEARMVVLRDRLTEILAKAEARKFKVAETYEVLKELGKGLTEGVNALPPDLDVILEHYQLSMNYLYTVWMKKLRGINYEVTNPIKIGFEKGALPEQRVAYIRTTLAASRATANEVCKLAEQIYGVLRAMYDPSLPPESSTVVYCQQKLTDKTAPWIACDALVIAIKNWERLYQSDIAKSMVRVRDVLGSITELGASEKTLRAAFGDKYPTVADQITKASELKAELEAAKITILNVMVAKKFLESTLFVMRTIVSTTIDELKTKEDSINSLSPIKEDFWEKNITLTDQILGSFDKISDAKKYDLFSMLKTLPEPLTLMDSCLWTIIQYNQKNELLLNYPVAKNAIEAALKKKKRITVQDLPFKAEEAEKYLKLFWSERNSEFTFDEENLQLSAKH
jgi:hypothetical protein